MSKIREFWIEGRLEHFRFTQLSSWWDAGKVRLKRNIKEWSKIKANEHNQRVEILNFAINEAHKRIDMGDDLCTYVEDLNMELTAELLEEAKGAQIRARVQWAEEGESSTAYFLRSEKIEGKRRLISQIQDAK